jgi:nicotinate-nucleotide adenylyltransferase
MTKEVRADVFARRFAPFPPHARGMRIGLFGGSFDPPHVGHRLASLIALKRLGLDRVWWLVTPGNPLKDTQRLPPIAARLQAARATADDPRIVVTALEAALGSRHTFQTISSLVARCPGVHFVWIMGADNLAGFHRWRRWAEIAALVPMAVIDRPGSSAYAMSTRLGARLAARRVDEARSKQLPLLRPPAFVFLHGLSCEASSTQMRRRMALTTSRPQAIRPDVARRAGL